MKCRKGRKEIFGLVSKGFLVARQGKYHLTVDRRNDLTIYEGKEQVRSNPNMGENLILSKSFKKMFCAF